MRQVSAKQGEDNTPDVKAAVWNEYVAEVNIRCAYAGIKQTLSSKEHFYNSNLRGNLTF